MGTYRYLTMGDVRRGLATDGDAAFVFSLYGRLRPLLKPRTCRAAFRAIASAQPGAEVAAAIGADAAGAASPPGGAEGAGVGAPAFDTGGVAEDYYSEALLKAAFDRLDINGDGFVTKGEVLAAALHNTGVRALLRASDALRPLLDPDTYAEAFRKLDTDRSNSVDFSEFQAFVVAQQRSRRALAAAAAAEARTAALGVPAEVADRVVTWDRFRWACGETGDYEDEDTLAGGGEAGESEEGAGKRPFDDGFGEF